MSLGLGQMGLNMGVRNVAGVSFSLPSFLTGLSDAAFYDFTDTTSQFQEEFGQTPADGATEAIGLKLDKALWNGKTETQVLAAQTQLANPDTQTLNQATGVRNGAGFDLTATDDFMGIKQEGIVSGTRYFVHFAWSGNDEGNLAYLNVGSTGVSASGFGNAIAGDVTVRGLSDGTQVHPFFVGSVAGDACYMELSSIKAIPGLAAYQASANYKPKVDAHGAKGDGVDDRMQTTKFVSNAADNFFFDYADIPASLATTQALCGAINGSGDSWYVAVTTGGALRFKVGSTTIDSAGIDLRGATHMVGVWTDGSTAYLFVDGAIVGSGAWTGSLPIATNLALFALNNNGTPAAFFGGSLGRPLFGVSAMTLARANQIRADYLATFGD